MSITLNRITVQQHQSAIEWIAGTLPHQIENVHHLTPMQAYRIIKGQYEGGWPQFTADSQV